MAMTVTAFIKTNEKTLATGEILIKRPHFEAFCECQVCIVYTTGKEQGSAKAYVLSDLTLTIVDKEHVKMTFNDKQPIDSATIREYQYDEREGVEVAAENPEAVAEMPRFSISSDLSAETRVSLPYAVRMLIAEYKCGLFNTATFKRRMTCQKFKVVSLTTRARHEPGSPYTIFRHRLSQLALISDGKNNINVYL
ncbi:hypothetical protein HOT49_gp258 [Erwinia phage vB_EamM_Alexandra]|uniref:Uncharacterized protein n=1 Tax=Erwinia phage vB_EamM_Alexandra TaxID=2201424 RepID=A0A2Z4QEH5_9CAUD|nr:hypothetical protein HOT49_gp258 [Erwinia phage vB_EamM_Alexandra]AWY08517.1 hypothetical protein Alexandra_260 [Erwinia phage vB_EamM_Alexandra]